MNHEKNLHIKQDKSLIGGSQIGGVQDPRDGFGDYHSSSPERSQQRSQQP